MKVKHVEFRFSEDYLKYNKCREKFLRYISKAVIQVSGFAIYICFIFL